MKLNQFKHIVQDGITRRTFVKGAALSTAATAAALASEGCKKTAVTTGASPLVINEDDAINVVDTFKSVDSAAMIGLSASYNLPVGTVLFPSEGNWIATINASDNAAVLAACGAFSVSDGRFVTLMSGPVSTDSSYVIYKVACSDSLYAWVELDSVSYAWTLYASSFTDGALAQNASKIYSADANWDPPSITCTADTLIWTLMPNATGDNKKDNSICYLWKPGDKASTEAVRSDGRFGCEPSVCAGVVTLCPRALNSDGVYYAISTYDLASGMKEATSQIILPQSIKPFTACCMEGHLVFQVEASYSSGGLFSNMGTFVQLDDGKWAAYLREPSAAPAGKLTNMIIKSRSSYLVANMQTQQYGLLSAQDHSVDYGEYPARMGTCDNFVTFATIKDAATGYPSNVLVRVYSC